MYCIKCGVRLADTEQRCPLCGTDPKCPDIEPVSARPLYPRENCPPVRPKTGAVNGTILVLFLIPLLVTFLVDLQADRQLGWFGFPAGGLAVAYVSFALPRWFRKPNPIIFVPCAFGAAIVYLLYLSLATGGNWFLPFGFPVAGGIGLIVTAVVVLLRCLRRGHLYIMGGAVIALGGFMLLLEFLLTAAFGVSFTGWSFYPLAVLVLLGGLLIFLAINRSAREMMERKIFI